MFMKYIYNRIEVNQGKTFNTNLEYFDIDYSNKKKYNPDFNNLKNKVFSLKKNKIDYVDQNCKEKQNKKFHASKNSINFSTFNLYENRSNFGEKSNNSFYNFFNSRVSKSREKITYSSSSFLRQNNTNKDINNMKHVINKNQNKTAENFPDKQNNYLSSNNKQSSVNKFSESMSNYCEKEACMVDILLKENKEVNKLKYITPFLLKELLTKEKSEIKNPFQDSILYPIKDSCENKEGAISFNSKKLKDEDKIKSKLTNTKKKKLLLNEELKDTLSESRTPYNLEKGKSEQEEISRFKKEENCLKIHPENKSSGVQCTFDVKVIDSPLTHIIKEDFKVNSPRGSDNIIKNVEIRENIKLEKPKITIEDSKNLVSINIYNTQLKANINEISKNINKRNDENRRKSKTPNFMKSTISEQNKLLNVKKVSSGNPSPLGNQNKDENCYIKYENHKKNFKNAKEKFKKFFQISNYEEADQIKYGIVIKKKGKSRLRRDADKGSIDYNQIDVLRCAPNSIENNNWSGEGRVKFNRNYSSFDSNEQDNKYLHFNNNNEDLLKVYLDKSINRFNENYKKNGFIENCNTSNGFINMGEFNFLERNNLYKNVNNPFNSSLKSKENESNIYILSINKSPNNKFGSSVDCNDENNALSKRNLHKIERKNEENKESINNGNNPNNKFLTKPLINNLNINKKNNSNKRFKVLKKELNKDKDKLNFKLENFKESL